MNSIFSKSGAFRLYLRFGMTCAVAILVALAVALTAEAAGFNVNPDVTLTPITSTYHTTTDTTGCPAGFAGKFTFTALLTNKPASAAMPGVAVKVVTLTNGNLLLDPETTYVHGEGGVMQVPKSGQYADGLLSPGESVNVPFVLCLKSFQPFHFFVDVYGVVTKLVSINQAGTDSGNGSSAGTSRSVFVGPGTIPLQRGPILSNDGRFMVFESKATDLVTTAGFAQWHPTRNIFVRDVQTSTTMLVTISRDGTENANGDSTDASISSDGRFVTFVSYADNLVANPTYRKGEVFIRDLYTSSTQLVSVNRTGTGSNVSCRPDDPFNEAEWPCSFGARMTLGGSGYGVGVAFVSFAKDLVATPTNGFGDVFVRGILTDASEGRTISVSTDQTAGRTFPCKSNGSIYYIRPCARDPQISVDGRYVAFFVEDSNFVGNIYVRDTDKQKTNRVNPATDVNGNEVGAAVSPFAFSPYGSSSLGAWLAFTATTTTGRRRVFLANYVSLGVAAPVGDGVDPMVSIDGRFVGKRLAKAVGGRS